MYLLYTIIIINRIDIYITCIDSGDSYPDDLIAYGLTKELSISAMSEIEDGNASVWSLWQNSYNWLLQNTTSPLEKEF